MNSIRSFIRYLAPGVILLVELVLLLVLASPSEALCWFGQLQKEVNIGTIFGGVIILGGFGYLISIIHHNIFWHCTRYATVDLRALVGRLQNIIGNDNQRKLVLSMQEDALKDSEENNIYILSRDGAWRAVAALWYMRHEDSNRIKGATGRNESLHDLMHGAGSGLIASIISLILFLSVACSYFTQARFDYAVVVWLVLLFFHIASYRFTGRQSQGFVELVLFDEIVHTKEPVLLHITQRELERPS